MEARLLTEPNPCVATVLQRALVVFFYFLVIDLIPLGRQPQHWSSIVNATMLYTSSS